MRSATWRCRSRRWGGATIGPCRWSPIVCARPCARICGRQDDAHRDVLFFIHGHRLSLPGLRLGLLRELHDRYVGGPRGPVGVIVFFSWPDRGWPWSEDDEAYRAGRAFFAQGSGLLAALSDAANGRLHLLAQSFGHHLLAGMVAQAVAEQHDAPPFRACLLVGADVPQEAIGAGGVRVSSRGDAGRSYRFDRMDRLGERTVVYYDRRDRILPGSRTGDDDPLPAPREARLRRPAGARPHYLSGRQCGWRPAVSGRWRATAPSSPRPRSWRSIAAQIRS